MGITAGAAGAAGTGCAACAGWMMVVEGGAGAAVVGDWDCPQTNRKTAQRTSRPVTRAATMPQAVEPSSRR